MNVKKNNQSFERVCDLKYLTEMMGNKKILIKGIMDAFLKQIPEELKSIKDAIAQSNYSVIKSFAHTMKSSVSIMGISILSPILQEMEDLAVKAVSMERIEELDLQLCKICDQAMEEIEIEIEKNNYSGQ